MKAIYVHGLASGAASKTGRLLAQYLQEYEWTFAEMTHHCEESLAELGRLINDVKPDLVCGTSLGGYYIACLADKIEARMILVNPALNAGNDIRQFIGTNKYFCKRRDGAKTFILTEEDCAAMRPYEKVMKNIEGNSKVTVFLSDHDEVLGRKYYEELPALGTLTTVPTTLMGHSMTEDFISEQLVEYVKNLL